MIGFQHKRVGFKVLYWTLSPNILFLLRNAMCLELSWDFRIKFTYADLLHSTNLVSSLTHN